MQVRRGAGWCLVAALVAGYGGLGCGDDEAAGADYVIEIQTARFFPTPISIPVGSTVRWVNVNPRDTLRTVTSGEGPADTTAGNLFDVLLRGYSPGEAEGEDYIHKFEERGSYPYFSRRPPGREFFGRIEVQ